MFQFSFQIWELILQFISNGYMELETTVAVGAQLLWIGPWMVATSGRYGCAIVMSYTEIDNAVPHWLLTFNLCVDYIYPWMLFLIIFYIAY